MGWGRRAVLCVTWWVALMGAWLLLTFTLDPAELAAGAVAATIATVVAELVRVQDLRTLRLQPRWIPRARVLPGLIIADCGVVLAAVVRRLVSRHPVTGSFFAVPFDPGDTDDPVAAARRALVTAAISVTPNTYVVGIDNDRDLLLIHQLVPAPRSQVRSETLGRL